MKWWSETTPTRGGVSLTSRSRLADRRGLAIAEQHRPHGGDDDARLAGFERRAGALADRPGEADAGLALLRNLGLVVPGQAEQRLAGAVLFEGDVEGLERAAGGVDDDLEVAALSDQLGRLDELDRGPGGPARGQPDAAGDHREDHDEGEELPHARDDTQTAVPGLPAVPSEASVGACQTRGVEGRSLD